MGGVARSKRACSPASSTIFSQRKLALGPYRSGSEGLGIFVMGPTAPRAALWLWQASPADQRQRQVDGRISLIELSAGFHPEISGRENVFINGIMLGLTKREIQSRFDEIVEFAELRDFIDAPVKTYSSGMYMRLGFAVAINVDPDVLLVDEVLAVGDEGFTHKCLDKFGEFRRRGKTILLVTHSLNLIERFCDEAIWLDAGEKQAEGDPKRVIGAYLTAVEATEEQLLAGSSIHAHND
jgi:ABC-type polysaccharide/polyol phosphate transport system ATPase subunit